jgi:hypothetical protein
MNVARQDNSGNGTVSLSFSPNRLSGRDKTLRSVQRTGSLTRCDRSRHVQVLRDDVLVDVWVQCNEWSCAHCGPRRAEEEAATLAEAFRLELAHAADPGVIWLVFVTDDRARKAVMDRARYFGRAAVPIAQAGGPAVAVVLTTVAPGERPDAWCEPAGVSGRLAQEIADYLNLRPVFTQAAGGKENHLRPNKVLRHWMDVVEGKVDPSAEAIEDAPGTEDEAPEAGAARPRPEESPMTVLVPDAAWLAWLNQHRALLIAKDWRTGRCAWQVPGEDHPLAAEFHRRLGQLRKEQDPHTVRLAKREARRAFEWVRCYGGHEPEEPREIPVPPSPQQQAECQAMRAGMMAA